MLMPPDSGDSYSDAHAMPLTTPEKALLNAAGCLPILLPTHQGSRCRGLEGANDTIVFHLCSSDPLEKNVGGGLGVGIRHT